MRGSILLTGFAGSVSSAAALALAARVEGKAPLQPINATSHWLNGDRAAQATALDARHTLVGSMTHLAATLFWAGLLEWWLGRRGAAHPAAVVGAAAVVSAIAVPVDYLATPGRFTPGWEFVLSRRAIAAGYVGMAAGMGGASALVRSRRRRSSARTKPGVSRTA